MPLQLPNLDDRTYQDLVAEAIALIPRHAPSWTNYNPSDPGITLIELLAYFTEMLIYRLDRIGLENKISFLRLLAGAEGIDNDELQTCSLEQIEQRIQQVVLALKQRHRAVTRDDYEYLAKQAALKIAGNHPSIRVCCVEGKNLSAGVMERDVDCPGHISLIVVADRDQITLDYEQMLKEVRHDLEPKRLLATRLHVVKPCYVWLALSFIIQPRPDVSWDSLKTAIPDLLGLAFSPVAGGDAKETGWPFGRNIYLSEIADVLEQVAGVDYIESIIFRRLSLAEEDLYTDQAVIGVQIGVSSTVGVDTRIGARFSDIDRFIPDGAGKIAGILLKPYELLKIVVREQDIRPAFCTVT